VGHETDFSISDFVADLRAPTPSAAAELVMPEKRVLKERVEFLQKRLSNALVNALKRERQRILRLSSSRSIIKPFEVVDRKRLMLDSVYRHMLLIHKSCMQTHRGRLQVLAGRLDALSPLTVLARGYAVAQGEDGSLITSVKALKTGDRIKLTLARENAGAV
jgi:exodeoxyribonuclease VII large subunit